MYYLFYLYYLNESESINNHFAHNKKELLKNRYCDSPVLCLTHPHVCRHTYCSNIDRSRISVKTLQYLMGHSDISTTLNVYTHEDFTGAEEELKRLSII